MLMRHTYNDEGFEGEVRYYRSALTGRRICFGAGTYSVHQADGRFYLQVHATGARYQITANRPERIEQIPPPRHTMYHVRTIDMHKPNRYDERG